MSANLTKGGNNRMIARIVEYTNIENIFGLEKAEDT